MRRRLLSSITASLVLVGPALLPPEAAATEAADGVVHSIELTGTIDPASAAWLDEALSEAERSRAPLAILRLDTPGGLETSMRHMVQRIGASEVPVVVYVSPDGARAASAGLFVTLAADVAAMAPQTNIGSATPVQLRPGPESEVLGRKVRNDAAAFVRALAEAHGRNPDLAERMVREAVNVTAERARAAGLVDLVAADEQELMVQLDGLAVEGPKATVLDTRGLRVERRDMPFTFELRQFLVNPTVAFLLLVAGAVGLALEVASPGAIGPGALGAVALLLGLYGTLQLPVTLVGALLIVLALGLLAAETQLSSGGILGAAGIAALIAGGLLLFDTDSAALAVSVPAAVAAGLALGGFGLFAASRALSARRASARGGTDELVGAKAWVREPLDPQGQVFVGGALWRARAADAQWIDKGQQTVVERVEGLTLAVRPAGETETAATREGPPPNEGSTR